MLIMQLFSGKIEVGKASVISTPLFLSNQPIREVKMTTNNLPLNQKSIKICSVEGCDRVKQGRGLCLMHWKRWRNHGSTDSLYKTDCSILDCEGTHCAKSFCKKHYEHFRLHGNPLTVLNVGKGVTAKEKFWSKVVITADTERCWEWQGAKGRGSYGISSYRNKTITAHRLAWFFVYEEMPKLQVLHSCDNRICVNPNHLREGTNQDNVDDKVNRNRQPMGEHHKNAKLTNNDVLQIRQLLSNRVLQVDIAKMFKVSTHTISAIKKGLRWSHVIAVDLVGNIYSSDRVR